MDSQDHVPVDGPARFFAYLSRYLGELRDAEPQPTTLQRVVEQAVETVPGCDFASVTLRRRRHRVMTAASTSQRTDALDAIQHEFDEGPCLDAVWEGEWYLASDIGNDARWPRWGPAVAELGIGSVLAVRLSTETESLGAINLYSEQVDAFSPDDVDLALVFAAHAAVALNAAQLVSGLQSAVQSRHLIGVAQGVLMQRYGLTLESSFEVLRRYSSEANIKLRDVAATVVQRRELPGDLALRPDGEDGHRQPDPDPV